MEKQKEVLRILLKHYTKIGHGGGIAKVIFDDDFENIAEEIVKLFAIPIVSGSALTQDQKNDIACDFMAKFGGLHRNTANDGLEADKIIQWAIKQAEHYR